MKNKRLYIIFCSILAIGVIISMEYNIQMQQRNSDDTDWDNNYPITKAENVITSNGNVGAELLSIKASKVDKIELNPINTSVSNLQTQIASVASGSPKGTYATLAALQTAFPTGNSNIYVVTADGKWYYWNGAVWEAGGTYQSTGIADESVDYYKLDDMLKNNLFNITNVTLYQTADSSGVANLNGIIRRIFASKTVQKHYMINKGINVEYVLEAGKSLSGIIELWTINGTALTKVKTVTFNVTGATGIGVTGKHFVPIEYKANAETYISLRMAAYEGDYSRFKIDINGSNGLYIDDSSSTVLDISQLNLAPAWDLALDLDIIKLLPLYINKGYVVVDINGNGDYTSVIDAVQNEPEDTVIKILPGVYEGTIQAFSKRIILIGTDKNQCILKSTDGRYEYPVINGSCGYIENLTLYSQYVNGVSNEIDSTTSGAYAFHCEDEYGVGKTLELNNCVLKSDFFPALGMGLRKDFTCIINNCELISNQVVGRANYSDVGSLGALYFHDTNGVVGNQYIKVKDSVIRSSLENALCIYDLQKIGSSINCEFINNTIYSEINGFSNVIYWRGVSTPFNGNFNLNGISHGNTDISLNNN